VVYLVSEQDFKALEPFEETFVASSTSETQHAILPDSSAKTLHSEPESVEKSLDEPIESQADLTNASLVAQRGSSCSSSSSSDDDGDGYDVDKGYADDDNMVPTQDDEVEPSKTEKRKRSESSSSSSSDEGEKTEQNVVSVPVSVDEPVSNVTVVDENEERVLSPIGEPEKDYFREPSPISEPDNDIKTEGHDSPKETVVHTSYTPAEIEVMEKLELMKMISAATAKSEVEKQKAKETDIDFPLEKDNTEVKGKTDSKDSKDAPQSKIETESKLAEESPGGTPKDKRHVTFAASVVDNERVYEDSESEESDENDEPSSSESSSSSSESENEGTYVVGRPADQQKEGTTAPPETTIVIVGFPSEEPALPTSQGGTDVGDEQDDSAHVQYIGSTPLGEPKLNGDIGSEESDDDDDKSTSGSSDSGEGITSYDINPPHDSDSEGEPARTEVDIDYLFDRGVRTEQVSRETNVDDIFEEEEPVDIVPEEVETDIKPDKQDVKAESSSSDTDSKSDDEDEQKDEPFTAETRDEGIASSSSPSDSEGETDNVGKTTDYKDKAPEEEETSFIVTPEVETEEVKHEHTSSSSSDSSDTDNEPGNETELKNIPAEVADTQEQVTNNVTFTSPLSEDMQISPKKRSDGDSYVPTVDISEDNSSLLVQDDKMAFQPNESEIILAKDKLEQGADVIDVKDEKSDDDKKSSSSDSSDKEDIPVKQVIETDIDAAFDDAISTETKEQLPSDERTEKERDFTPDAMEEIPTPITEQVKDESSSSSSSSQSSDDEPDENLKTEKKSDTKLDEFPDNVAPIEEPAEPIVSAEEAIGQDDKERKSSSESSESSEDEGRKTIKVTFIPPSEKSCVDIEAAQRQAELESEQPDNEIEIQSQPNEDDVDVDKSDALGTTPLKVPTETVSPAEEASGRDDKERKSSSDSSKSSDDEGRKTIKVTFIPPSEKSCVDIKAAERRADLDSEQPEDKIEIQSQNVEGDVDDDKSDESGTTSESENERNVDHDKPDKIAFTKEKEKSVSSTSSSDDENESKPTPASVIETDLDLEFNKEHPFVELDKTAEAGRDDKETESSSSASSDVESKTPIKITFIPPSNKSCVDIEGAQRRAALGLEQPEDTLEIQPKNVEGNVDVNTSEKSSTTSESENEDNVDDDKPDQTGFTEEKEKSDSSPSSSDDEHETKPPPASVMETDLDLEFDKVNPSVELDTSGVYSERVETFIEADKPLQLQRSQIMIPVDEVLATKADSESSLSDEKDKQDKPQPFDSHKEIPKQISSDKSSSSSSSSSDNEGDEDTRPVQATEEAPEEKIAPDQDYLAHSHPAPSAPYSDFDDFHPEYVAERYHSAIPVESPRSEDGVERPPKDEVYCETTLTVVRRVKVKQTYGSDKTERQPTMIEQSLDKKSTGPAITELTDDDPHGTKRERSGSNMFQDGHDAKRHEGETYREQQTAPPAEEFILMEPALLLDQPGEVQERYERRAPYVPTDSPPHGPSSQPVLGKVAGLGDADGGRRGW